MSLLNVSPTFFRGQSTLGQMINLIIYPVARWQECQLFNGFIEIMRSAVPCIKLDDYDRKSK